MEQTPELLAEDSDDEGEKQRKKKYEHFDPEHKVLDKDGLYYKDSDEDSDKSGSEGESGDSDQEDLGLKDEAEEDEDKNDAEEEDEKIDQINDGNKNSLLVDLSAGDRKSRKEMKADVWFGKDVFKGIEDDEDLEEADVEAAIKSIKKKGGKIPEKAQKKATNQPHHLKNRPQVQSLTQTLTKTNIIHTEIKKRNRKEVALRRMVLKLCQSRSPTRNVPFCRQKNSHWAKSLSAVRSVAES